MCLIPYNTMVSEGCLILGWKKHVFIAQGKLTVRCGKTTIA
jgi:hypothetical protein